MEPHTARAEAERWVGISAKLLTGRDLAGSKTFAMRAREADPSNPLADQILAVVDTLIAAEKRVINSTNYDWYSILQLPHLVRDPDVIASQYGRLVMLLNPEHNGLPYADLALRLVVDAWSVLSDSAKKWMYDSELTLFLQRSSTSAASVDFHQVDQPPESVRVDPSSTFQFFQQPPQPQPQPQQPQQWLYHHQQQQPQLQERQLLQQHHNPPPQPQPQPQRPPQAPPQPQLQRPTRPREQQIPPQPQIQQQQPVSTHRIPQQQQQHGERGRVEEVNGRARNLEEGRGTHNVGKDGGIANNYYDDDNGVDDEDSGDDDDDNDNDDGIESFWTTCPYCYYTYEYPKTFQDCTLRCQNCRRAFHALQIPNPPPITRGGKETTYCCWGFFPLGFSMTTWKRNNPFAGSDTGIGMASSSMPFSHIFATQQAKRNFVRGPVVYLDDDEDFDVSNSSDDSDTSDDWYSTTPSKPRKKRKSVKRGRRGKVGRKSNAEKERLRMMNQNLGGVAGGVVSKNSQGMAEKQANTPYGFAGAKNDVTNKAGGSGSSRKQTGKGVRGRKKLDLNVEFRNEVEEHAPTVSAGNGEEEVGFFEGLDEFLSTLPLLHPVGDDKAKPS